MDPNESGSDRIRITALKKMILIKDYGQEVKKEIVEYNIDITTNADYNVKQERCLVLIYLKLLLFFIFR